MSRLVWAVKGLLGRPIAVAADPPRSHPPTLRGRRSETLDLRVRIALEAAWTLQARVLALEGDASADAPDKATSRPPAIPRGAPASWSVIVPTLDRAAWLDRALWALAYQGHAAFEVIVVRGPCRDATDAVLARHAGRIGVVHCAEANLSAARNAGLAVACGEAVAFLDDDAAPEPDWLERLGEGLADPGVGGVGGFIRDATGLAFQCRTVVADRFGASRDIGVQARRLDPPGPGAERYLSLTGANCGFRRSALLEIGGFDEAFAYFLDETDVCLRLVEAGWRLCSVPAAEAHHAYAESPQRDAAGTPRRLIDCARSTAYFAVRHGAPRFGLVEAATRLHAYAEGLARDTRWRADHGLVATDTAEQMLEEIEAGVSQGVRAALSGPPRRMRACPGPRRAAPVLLAAPAALRPATDRLRLALLCQDHAGVEPPAQPPGGIAVWTRTLAEALAQRGHEVSVFARSPDGTSTVRFETTGDAGLWVHRVAASARASRSPVLAAAPASIAEPAAARAAEVLRVTPRRRFDLAIGPLWDLEPAGLVGRAPFPVAVSLHTSCAQIAADRPDWDEAYRRNHVAKAIAAERRLLSIAPHLLANSPTALADLAATFGLPDLAARASILPHGLPDLARGVTPGAPDAGVEFLFVGRFERRKGIDVVLEAAPAVLAAAPEARLVLVGEETGSLGDTPLAELFRRRYAGAPWLERASFLGPLPRSELLARYAACDVVLMPSRYESFGLVALEAMVFAKPCIVGDAGGLRDLVVEGETGVRVAPGDADALTAAMLQLAAAPQRRATMGAAGRRRYEAFYTSARMVDGFEAWARDVIGRRDERFAAE